VAGFLTLDNLLFVREKRPNGGLEPPFLLEQNPNRIDPALIGF
jgi:hypothetical protein